MAAFRRVASAGGGQAPDCVSVRLASCPSVIINSLQHTGGASRRYELSRMFAGNDIIILRLRTHCPLAWSWANQLAKALTANV